MKGIARITLSAAFSLALLCSCASTKVPSPPKIFVTNTKRVQLLPPVLMNAPLEGVFLFQGNFGGQSLSTPVYVKADEEGLFMQMLSAFGSGIATVSFDGGRVDFASSVLPSDLKVEYIIADFQFAYYDFEPVRQVLRDASLVFQCKIDGDVQVRSILSKDKLISQFTVDCAANTVTVKNFLRGYEYSLTGAFDESE